MTPSDARPILERSKTVAVVGASTDPEKAAHRIPQLLIDRGFTVIPVHPKAEEIFGIPAVASLHDIEGQVDIVDVFRPSEEAEGIARDAVAIGAGALWLQLGITSPEARAVAEEAGIDYVEDLCIGATVRKLDLRAA
jgi:uncharacterized protein